MEEGQGGRDWSIDLLRILSMLMIIVIHTGNHGGMLEAYPVSSVNHWLARALNSFAMVSVSVFVLISGYFLIKQKLRLRKVLSIVTQVWFYSWLIMILALLFRPAGLSASSFSLKALASSLLPISLRRYWFASMYIGLYLLTPLLNKALTRLTRLEHRRLVIFLFLITSVWSNLIPTADLYSMSRGFGVSWFVFLYVYAGYIRLHGSVFRPLTRRCYMLVCAAAALMMTLAYEAMIVLGGWFPKLHEVQSLPSLFGNYTSILNFVGSAALFLAFVGRPVKSGLARKTIGFFAPLTFGVYLIHDNAITQNLLWRSPIRPGAIPDQWYAVPLALAIVAGVFAVCIAIEFLRKMLFGLWEKNARHNAAIDRLEGRFSRFLNAGDPTAPR